MSDYTRRTRRRPDGVGSGAGGNIMIFLGGAVVILGLIIVYQKNASSGPSGPPMLLPGYNDNLPTPAPENGTSGDAEYVKRGFIPNKKGAVPDGGTPPATPRFVGDSEWKQYHLPDCRRVKGITDYRRALFATPEEAFAAGYIPCKICKPEAPAGRATNPVTAVPPKTTPKTKTGDVPVSLPIKDVEVPFPFSIASRDPVNERGVIRIEFEVDVQKPLGKEDSLLLARKIVAQETAKGPVNAVTMTIRLDPKSPSMIKWICVVDWAPWGVLSRGGEVKTGDYANHQFNIYHQGFITKGK